MSLDYIMLKVLPQNRDFKIDKGTNLLKAIQDNNIEIDAVCGGVGKCGKCKVRVVQGELSEVTDDEIKLLRKVELENNIVLACKRNLIEDTTILMNSENEFSSSKNNIVKNNKDINPIVKKYYHKLNKPTIDDPISDVDRLLREFSTMKSMDVSLVCQITKRLEEGNYGITTTVLDEEIINIESGDKTSSNYGISIDIGTTTVAAYLINLNNGEIVESIAHSNLQKKFGADVISRVNYAMQSEENLSNLKNLVIETIDRLIFKLLEKAKIHKDGVSIIMILGNTVMSHILIGVNPKSIAIAPFSPVFTKSIKGDTKFLGINSLNSKTKFVLMPNIAGYVGSDTLGVAISSSIYNKAGNHLAIDVGTNCELILKTNDRILTCSTAAGPAFEGANMSCGMRAKEGAVIGCKISEDREDLEFEVVGDVDVKGICGSGYIEIISSLLDLKILKKQGRIKKFEDMTNVSDKIKNKIHKYNASYKISLSDKGDVFINQNDISNLQLAKGAVKSGIEIMLREANVKELDSVLLAGAFGSNLNIESLIKIKMIPEVKIGEVHSIGNAAGSGAIDTLLHQDIYDNMLELQSKIEHIELASHKDFQNIFAKSIMF